MLRRKAVSQYFYTKYGLCLFSSIGYFSLGGRKASVMAYASEKRQSAKSSVLKTVRACSQVLFISLCLFLYPAYFSLGRRKASVMAYASEKRHSAIRSILNTVRSCSLVFYFSLIVPLSCLLLSGGEESQCDGLCFGEKAFSHKIYTKYGPCLFSSILFLSDCSSIVLTSLWGEESQCDGLCF
jgi:hypothetical protein